MLASHGVGFYLFGSRCLAIPQKLIKNGPRLFIVFTSASWTINKLNNLTIGHIPYLTPIFMKKFKFYHTIIIALVAITLASCGSGKKVTYIVPNAINTVNSVSLNELNLTGGDYQILNTITSEATITATIKKNNATIWEVGNEFFLHYKDFGFGLKLDSYSGVVRLGYLSNMYSRTNFEDFNPEEIAIRLASYRAINIAQQHGTDGLIEPIISTKAEQIGENITFQTTVTAKLVKLKTSK